MEDLRARLKAPRAVLDVVWVRGAVGDRLFLLDPWELGDQLFYARLRRDRRAALDEAIPPDLVVPSVAGEGLEEFVEQARQRAVEGVAGVVFKYQLGGIACACLLPSRNDTWIASAF